MVPRFNKLTVNAIQLKPESFTSCNIVACVFWKTIPAAGLGKDLGPQHAIVADLHTNRHQITLSASEKEIVPRRI